MRVFIAVLVLIFSLQSWTKADDIRDFEIEGMSIGDSLLDYFSKDEIDNYKKYYPNSKEWVMFVSDYEQRFETYDVIQAHFKNEDSKYIIGALDGLTMYENNIKDCYKKMNEIEEEISEIFKNTEKVKDKSKHDYDPSGKTIVKTVEYWFKSGDVAMLECTDWNEDIDIHDKMSIKIGTKEFIDWINTKAY